METGEGIEPGTHASRALQSPPPFTYLANASAARQSLDRRTAELNARQHLRWATCRMIGCSGGPDRTFSPAFAKVQAR